MTILYAVPPEATVSPRSIKLLENALLDMCRSRSRSGDCLGSLRFEVVTYS